MYRVSNKSITPSRGAGTGGCRTNEYTAAAIHVYRLHEGLPRCPSISVMTSSHERRSRSFSPFLPFPPPLRSLLAPYFFRVLLARSVTSARVAMLSFSSRPPERYLYSFLSPPDLWGSELTLPLPSSFLSSFLNNLSFLFFSL